MRIESCLEVEEAQGVARMRENRVELVEVAFGLRHRRRQKPVLLVSNECILDVLGGRTSATRHTKLMWVIEEPVIPYTKASSVLYISFSRLSS